MLREIDPNKRHRLKGRRTEAVYLFVGPDGKEYRKSTHSAHGETAYAQFIQHPEKGWCFIGMESLVRYLAFEHMSRPKIHFILAKRVCLGGTGRKP